VPHPRPVRQEILQPAGSSLPRYGALVATTRTPERLMFFTDGVTAIAVTLLILPLVDVVTSSKEQGLTAPQMITHHSAQIWTFLLSFVVIARFWMVHHRLFEHVRSISTPLVVLNLAWLLMVVVLPFPTEVTGVYETSRFTSGLYVGAILLLALLQTAMVVLIHRTPALAEPDQPVPTSQVASAVIMTGLFTIAFLLAVLVPAAGFYSLFVAFLAPVVSRVRARWGLFV